MRHFKLVCDESYETGVYVFAWEDSEQVCLRIAENGTVRFASNLPLYHVTLAVNLVLKIQETRAAAREAADAVEHPIPVWL